MFIAFLKILVSTLIVIYMICFIRACLLEFTWREDRSILSNLIEVCIGLMIDITLITITGIALMKILQTIIEYTAPLC